MSDIIDIPASISTSATTGNKAIILANKVKKYDTSKFIKFLRE